jgi:branched-chain amino acid transport system ATP-binding protein
MGMLEIKNLSKYFGGLKAVNRLSITIEKGQIVGLIGPNGSGKTTVFNLITGFLRPEEGEIYFDGRSLIGFKPHVICSKGISRTFQVVKPFLKLTVLENVMIGAFHITKDPVQAEGMAKEVIGSFEFKDKMHHPVTSLTLSERKQLEIARTLATQPKLLLLDESMAGLNPTEIDQMIDVLRKVRNDHAITLLVIEHVMRAIMAISDKIIVIHHGEKIAEGTPQGVTHDEHVITAYLGREYLAA